MPKLPRQSLLDAQAHQYKPEWNTLVQSAIKPSFFTNPGARTRIQVIDLSRETYTSNGLLHRLQLQSIKVE